MYKIARSNSGRQPPRTAPEVKAADVSLHLATRSDGPCYSDQQIQIEQNNGKRVKPLTILFIVR